MNKIAESLGGHMYSIEELAAWRVESINRIHALESALCEARETFKEIEEGKGVYSMDQFQHCANTVESMRDIARVYIKSIDALLGKEGK